MIVIFRNVDLRLCFSLWYEALENEDLLIANIDKVLNCTRLKKQRISGQENVLSTSREFGIVPLESIKSVVKLIPQDQCLT